MNVFFYILSTYRTWSYTGYARSRSRNSKSFLGAIWPGLSIFLTVAILSPLYSQVLINSSNLNYPLFLLIGLLYWSGINSSISRSVDSLATSTDVLLNTRIQPVFYLCEDVVYQFITLIESILFFLIPLFFVWPQKVFISLLFSLPFLFLYILYLFVLQSIFYFLIVSLTDFRNLVPTFLQVLFLATPVLYLPDRLGPLQRYLFLNPLASLLDGFRAAFLSQHFSLESFFLSILYLLFFIPLSLNLISRTPRIDPGW